jgi:cytosine/adenosine deaminase-related metal-dependent hydrolase
MRYHPDGALAVDRATGRFAFAGSWADFQDREPGLIRQARERASGVTLRRLEAHELLVPGFIDTHVHLPQVNVAGRTGVELRTCSRRSESLGVAAIYRPGADGSGIAALVPAPV